MSDTAETTGYPQGTTQEAQPSQRTQALTALDLLTRAAQKYLNGLDDISKPLVANQLQAAISHISSILAKLPD